MCKVISILLLSITLNAQAQFYYYPFPPAKADYKTIEKSAVTICYEYKVEANDKSLISILEYGSMGLPVVWYEKGTDLYGDSITTYETTYKYDKLQQLQSSTLTDFEEIQNSITGYTYDSKGRLIKKVFATIDPLTYKYSYNAAGRITKAMVTARMPAHDKDGEATGKALDKPMSKYLYKYDVKNRLIEEAHFFWEDGPLDNVASYKKKWTYNSKNQVISITLIDIDNAIIATDKLLYNDKGLLIKKSTSNSDGEEEEYIYEYCTDCKQNWMQ